MFVNVDRCECVRLNRARLADDCQIARIPPSYSLLDKRPELLRTFFGFTGFSSADLSFSTRYTYVYKYAMYLCTNIYVSIRYLTNEHYYLAEYNIAVFVIFQQILYRDIEDVDTMYSVSLSL